MAKHPNLNKPWRLIIPQAIYAKLNEHLYPGDGDEHGAVILAGIASADSDTRLLARSLHIAKDGIDYIPGERGYRMLTDAFISEHILKARDEQLAYLAIHNHPNATDKVSFSSIDIQSHERGYPALIDIAEGETVGALVFGTKSVAGDIWTTGRNRHILSNATVIGHNRLVLYPKPIQHSAMADPNYDRQTRLFGDKGQRILSQSKVAIIGLGGAGSIIAELLGRLGVGEFMLIDDDRVEPSNLPRLIGASDWDAMKLLANSNHPQWIRSLARRFSQSKVKLAKRNIRRANRKAAIRTFTSELRDPAVIAHIRDCDYIFLAADTMRAKLLFNAIVHQYLIPGSQVGVKIQNTSEGAVENVFGITRAVTSNSGCLMCNQAISPERLRLESISEDERRAQNYVGDPEVIAPSVISLNAQATAQAVNDFLFYMTGLMDADLHTGEIRFQPTKRQVDLDSPASIPTCVECGISATSRFAKGDKATLPDLPQ